MPFEPPIVSELVSFGDSTYPRRPQDWPAHTHGFHQFDATLSGEVFLNTEGRKTFRSRRGDGVLIPPMVRHKHRTLKGFRVGMFKFHVAPRYWALLGEKPFAIKLSADAVRGVERAGEAWNSGAPLRASQATAALTWCLVEAVRGARRTAPCATVNDAFRAQLWQLLERVEREPYGPWTVAGLAAACRLTPDHFAKCFRQALSQPPLEYLLHVRMRTAAYVLSADPDLAIKEAAERAGYATVHAFTRAFRRVIGVSPGQYRKTPGEM